MKKNIIFKIIVLFFALNFNNYYGLYSQQTNKWEFASTDDSITFHTNFPPVAKHSSYVNKNEIVYIGFNSKYIRRYYENNNFPDSTMTNTNLWTIFRYSDENNSNEILYKDDQQFDFSFCSISHPTKNIIAVVGDSVSFLGWFGGEKYKHNSLLLLSKNAGETWQTMVFDSNKIFIDISMCDANNGIIFQQEKNNYFNNFKTSEIDTLIITNDCWETITKKALPENSKKRIYCISPKTFIVICQNPENSQYYFSITTDGGNNWQNSAYFDFQIADLKYIDENNIFVSGYKFLKGGHPTIPKIYKSTDSGLNWTECKLFSDDRKQKIDFIRSIDFFDNNNGIIAAANSIFRTSDGGLTWQNEFIPFKFLSNSISLYAAINVIYPEKEFMFAILDNNFTIKCKNEKILLRPKFYPVYDNYFKQINNVKISWTSIQGANEYHIKIDSSKKTYSVFNFDNPLLDTIVKDTIFILNNLQYEHEYAGWVKAINENGGSDWYEKRNLFTTIEEDVELYPPHLVEPNLEYLVNPVEITFLWTKVPKAEKYIMMITKLENSQTFYSNSDITDTTIKIYGFEPFNVYRIKLSCYNKEESSDIIQYFMATSDETTSIKEITNFKNDKLYIFPNPAKEEINLIINNDFNQYVQVNIYNILGVPVKSTRKFLNYGEVIIRLETDSFSRGIYNIEVITRDKIHRGLFIKQ